MAPSCVGRVCGMICRELRSLPQLLHVEVLVKPKKVVYGRNQSQWERSRIDRDNNKGDIDASAEPIVHILWMDRVRATQSHGMREKIGRSVRTRCAEKVGRLIIMKVCLQKWAAYRCPPYEVTRPRKRWLRRGNSKTVIDDHVFSTRVYFFNSFLKQTSLHGNNFRYFHWESFPWWKVFCYQYGGYCKLPKWFAFPRTVLQGSHWFDLKILFYMDNLKEIIGLCYGNQRPYFGNGKQGSVLRTVKYNLGAILSNNRLSQDEKHRNIGGRLEKRLGWVLFSNNNYKLVKVE